jgi:glutamate 5-kinase
VKREIIIVKIGTQTMLQQDGLLDLPQLNKLMGQIISLEHHGYKVILVSSGAVAAGKSLQQDLSSFTDPVQERQVLASLGQALLMQQYNTLLKFYGFTAAQVLLTKMDFVSLTHRQNIYRALHGLIKLETCLPIINENDTTAIEELMFTDNDELTALIAILMKAKYMVVLTDVDGVYEGHPLDAQAKVIHKIAVDKQINISNQLTTGESGRGGIVSKVSACQKAANHGVEAFIANARVPDILIRLIQHKEMMLGTRIIADTYAKTVERDISLDFGVEPSITIDKSFAESFQVEANYTNIFPSNIEHIDGVFDKGDVVAIKNLKGQRLGIGIVEYNQADLVKKMSIKEEGCFIPFNKIVLFKS